MQNNKVVIFDFDGTIVDSIDVIVSVISKYSSGFTREDLRHLLTDIYVYRNKLKFVKLIWLELWVLIHASNIFGEFSKALEDVKVFDGMDGVLRVLFERGVPSYVVSGNNTNLIKKYLESHGLLNYFRGVIGTGSFGMTKKDSSIKKIQIQNPLKEVFYVGDEIRDVVYSKRAGVKSIAVTWGLSKSQDFRHLCPDFLVNTPAEILDIVLR